MIQGKGMFIWLIRATDGGNAQSIVQSATAAGLSHVQVKVADGANSFPDSIEAENPTVAAIAALKSAGLSVWGWQFVYGRDPHNPTRSIALDEANIAIQRVRTLGLDGFAIDFENSGNATFTYRGDVNDARIYMEHLRQGMPGVTLAASSHRFPSLHSNLPWDEFMSRCDVAMPQVYWVQSEPEPDVDESLRQYRARWPFLIYIPIGAAYQEAGWSATPDQVTRFMQHAISLHLPAVSFWSWQSARSIDLWTAIASFNWPSSLTPHPVPEHAVWVSAPDGLKFRSQPSLDASTWIDNVVFALGTQLTAIGDPSDPGAGGYRWQRVRAADGREGWVAYGIDSDVYLSDTQPVPLPAERPVSVIAPSGIKFRRQPSTSAEWINQMVFAPGTQLTAIGDPTEPDAQGYRWQQIRTQDGQVGWIARSQGDTLYLRG
jgi:hypothetical protein